MISVAILITVVVDYVFDADVNSHGERGKIPVNIIWIITKPLCCKDYEFVNYFTLLFIFFKSMRQSHKDTVLKKSKHKNKQRAVNLHFN